MKYFFIQILLVAQMSYAQQSTHTGNGGLVVICPPIVQGPKAQLLDFAEAEMLWQMKLRQNFRDSQVNAIVATVIGNLARLDDKLSTFLRSEFQSFHQNTNFLKNAELTRTWDEQNLATPAGCQLQQAVVQIEPRFPGEKRYNFSDRVWVAMDSFPRDKAGLIVHEMLYRKAIAAGHKTSREVRYLTALLFSEKIFNTTTAEYVTLRQQLNIAF